MKQESDSDAPRLILVTAPSHEVARALGRGLVERGLAACVNVLGGITSIYRWKEAVEEESEFLLLIKTRSGRVAAIEEFLQTEHPYDVPECVALAPSEVEPRYLQWLLDATD